MKGIIVPSYYPWWTEEGVFDYATLEKAAARMRYATLVTVINPKSGPLETDAYFNKRMDFSKKIRDAGHYAIGYVSTVYGRRPIDDIIEEVKLYLKQGLVNGIFCDEGAVLLSAREKLVAAVRDVMPQGLIVVNCGLTVAPMKARDVVTVTSESGWDYFQKRNVDTPDEAVLIHGYTSADFQPLYDVCTPEWMYASHVEFLPKNDVWGALHPGFSNLVDFVEAKAKEAAPDPVVEEPVDDPTDTDPEATFLKELSHLLSELQILVADEQARISKSV